MWKPATSPGAELDPPDADRARPRRSGRCRSGWRRSRQGTASESPSRRTAVYRATLSREVDMLPLAGANSLIHRPAVGCQSLVRLGMRPDSLLRACEFLVRARSRPIASVGRSLQSCRRRACSPREVCVSEQAASASTSARRSARARPASSCSGAAPTSATYGAGHAARRVRPQPARPRPNRAGSTSRRPGGARHRRGADRRATSRRLAAPFRIAAADRRAAADGDADPADRQGPVRRRSGGLRGRRGSLPGRGRLRAGRGRVRAARRPSSIRSAPRRPACRWWTRPSPRTDRITASSPTATWTRRSAQPTGS